MAHAAPRRIAAMAVTATCLAGGAAAAAEPSCAEALAVVGDAAVVAETRRALAAGVLAERRAGACADAELAVERDGPRVHVRLARGGRVVEHAADDLTTATSWVESWLVADDARPDPPAPALAATVAAPAPAPRGVPIELALRGGVDLDEVGPAWPGAELALSVGVARRLRLGIAGAAAWSVERDATERRALRLSARVAGLPTASERFALGCGLGIVSAAAERRLAGGGVLRDDGAEPFVEAFGTLDLPLGGGLALSFAALIRGHIPDDFGPEDEPEGDLEPRALPGMALTLQAGLAWRFEGGR